MEDVKIERHTGWFLPANTNYEDKLLEIYDTTLYRNNKYMYINMSVHPSDLELVH